MSLCVCVFVCVSLCVCACARMLVCVRIGYKMRMRGYRIYMTEGEAQGRVYSMTPNPNYVYNWLVPECGGVSISYFGSSRAVQCN